MQVDFWHDKWTRNEIGFHLPEVNPELVRHWPSLGVSRRVLVPLCGKTLDIGWLVSQGHRVVGVELSELALDALAEQLKRDHGIALERREDGGFIVYEGADILLFCGDFFSLTPALVGPVDAVYDRAALIALPADMRADYARHLQRLAGAAPMLLLTLDYLQERMPGPPFAVSDTEVRAHYGEHYAVELLEASELIEREPRFQARGLDALSQRVYLLRPAGMSSIAAIENPEST